MFIDADLRYLPPDSPGFNPIENPLSCASYFAGASYMKTDGVPL